jgi:hypothetical protein
VKLVDANILLYAYHASSSHHARALAWLEQALSVLAIERGGTLVGVNRGLRRYDGLKLLDPTARGVHDR